MNTPALDMFNSPYNQIHEAELQADSKIRCKNFWIYKNRNYPEIVYIPLSRRLEAKAISEYEFPDHIEPMPVAIYRKNHAISRNRPLDFYEYIGDDKK